MSPGPRPTWTIAYIGGSGRSGSTLLDRAIGQLPHAVSTGELLDVWRAGIGENRLCGCGERFADCGFWQRVGDEAYGGWSAIDASSTERLLKGLGYRRTLFDRPPPAELDAARRVLVPLYEAIASVSGSTLIVDSSKLPAYGALLAAVFPNRVRAVHLIRDSRGLAHSWAKRVKRPDTPGRDVEMLRMSPVSVAARWILHNAAMESLGARVPSVRVRYETFLQDPRCELGRILDIVGWPADDERLEFINGSEIGLVADHTVMGNPMRMKTGSVALRLDDQWRSNLPALDRLAVTALTWPWLLRYRYPIAG